MQEAQVNRRRQGEDQVCQPVVASQRRHSRAPRRRNSSLVGVAVRPRPAPPSVHPSCALCSVEPQVYNVEMGLAGKEEGIYIIP
ncbi:hypothetical protein PIB30_018916 [Stylosanthes scabra]|uniref:Uncharacterized protein n=1 Tax=Stylosanthes scabra TaxID=79078 RepID=A0ABU6X6A9_9FABA|nr:hypothetical protein [Stylosanthes scabra]